MQYDASSDRLTGNDAFQDLNGQPCLNCLMSLRRAKLLFDGLKGLSECYRRVFPEPADAGRSRTPFGIPLAVIEIQAWPVTDGDNVREISIEKLFERPDLSVAPLEFRQLARLVMIVPGSDIASANPPRTQSDIDAFARQLFGILYCTHRHARMSWSRRPGRLHPSRLSSRGEILDTYYLVSSTEARQALADLQIMDLLQSLAILWELTADSAQVFQECLDVAVRSYVNGDPGSALRNSASDLANRRSSSSTDDANALGQLATALFREGTHG